MYDFINVTFQFISVITGVLGVIVTVLLNFDSLKKTLRNKDVKKIQQKISLTRRVFIKGIAAVVVGFAGWGVLQLKPVKEVVKRSLYYFLPQGKNLIVNSKSGVIHHKILCSDHLPSKKNISNASELAVNSRFHETHKVAILSKITEGVSSEDAIEILMIATEDNPSSVHVYDKIVRLLGKLKRYESIHLLLENAENRLAVISNMQTAGSKQQRKYEKAIAHVKLQREKAKIRAKHAAFNVKG